jgi:hypothetical protein
MLSVQMQQRFSGQINELRLRLGVGGWHMNLYKKDTKRNHTTRIKADAHDITKEAHPKGHWTKYNATDTSGDCTSHPSET